MKKKKLELLVTVVTLFSVITGCGNTAAEPSPSETPTDVTEGATTNTDNTETAAANTDNTDTTANVESTDIFAAEIGAALPATFEELVDSLCAGQAYAYAPICEGEDALLVTSYVFDDLLGHQATYEATVFIEKDGFVEKVTTVQSGGTAYPIAVTDDNSLILSMRNSVTKGYVSKDTGKFVITEEANIDYSAAEDGIYHNYKDGVAEIQEDSSVFDELSEVYQNSEPVSFTKAGVSPDGTPKLSGAVYAAYKGDDLYNISSYYIFDGETSGSTQTPDGLSGLPFSYEINGEDITFHFASAGDNSKAKFNWDDGAFPTITFSENNEVISLSCLGNCDPRTFEALKYYDNDNNLYMYVKKFDETTLTGDIYRNEKIKANYVDEAKDGDMLFSVNGTQYTVASFEDANKELQYGTDEEFKWDSVGKSRFQEFIVKRNSDNFYFALEKGEYEQEYNVVPLFNEGNERILIEENVTFQIKENCEIILQKFVEDGEFSQLQTEYIVGREFKGDNYPNWTADAKEYYMTNGMLVALGVIDGELYGINQIYVP